MARFIIIDNHTGYIWGDTGDLNGPARDETPAEACQRLDERIGGDARTYTEHGAGYVPRGESAYIVYRADIGGSEVVPLTDNGQSQDTIEEVERLCRKVAVVTFETAADD